MNRPKTNTNPKHYGISNAFSVGIISPKPRHPVFASQVDIPILNTCDEYSYSFEDIANFLPSQFPRP